MKIKLKRKRIAAILSGAIGLTSITSNSDVFFDGPNRVHLYTKSISSIIARQKIDLTGEEEKTDTEVIKAAALSFRDDIRRCEVVKLNDVFDSSEEFYVIHLEKGAQSKFSDRMFLYRLEKHLNKLLPSEVVDKTVYALHDENNPFPLLADGTGRADLDKLREQGLGSTYKAIEENGQIAVTWGSSHIGLNINSKKLKMNKEE